MIVGIVNKILDFLVLLLNAVMVVLPDSPFENLQSIAISNDIFAICNYFLPLSEIVATCELWLVSITVYYCFMVIGRWAKVFE